MRRYCAEVPGPKMANLIEGGKTPLLSPAQLEAIGYTIAVYPLTLLNVSIQAMREALRQLKSGQRAGSRDGLRGAESRPSAFPRTTRKKRKYRSLGRSAMSVQTPSDAEPGLTGPRA